MERETLFEQHLSDYNILKEMYQHGKIPNLSQQERELLEFCNSVDMREFLRENVWEKPIVLNEDGSVNHEKTLFKRKPQEAPQQEQQKFYYLYDDEGNLVAALPKK